MADAPQPQGFQVNHFISIVVGGLITMGPQLLTMIPSQYRDVATAILGTIVAAYHLYQPSPAVPK